MDRDYRIGCYMNTQEAIEKVVEEARLPPEWSAYICGALRGMGYVCVPIVPSELMLKNAYYDALEEDARGVWKSMIDPEKALKEE